jgi:hypothetical protein
MRDGGIVGGFSDASHKRAQKQRDILPRNNRVGVRPISASRHSIASHQRQVRRLAARQGLSLMICAKPFGKVLRHGGYMLRSDETRRIVFGDREYDYSADLDEIETFLRAAISER